MDIKRLHSNNRKAGFLENYYRFHSRIYDSTRWSFLFGRDAILDMICDLPSRPRILEVGCGTGRNLRKLSRRFPKSEITGIDISRSMLSVAEKKCDSLNGITLIHGRYPDAMPALSPFDLILCSYSLTMFDSKISNAFSAMTDQLKPDGQLAIVDFHNTPCSSFQNWMHLNHVTMDGGIQPMANEFCNPLQQKIQKAYFGLWTYFLFRGTKP